MNRKKLRKFIKESGERYFDIAKKGGKVHIVGDAHKVGNLRTVIWQAWDIAMKL